MNASKFTRRDALKRKIAKLPQAIKDEARKTLERSAQALNKVQKQWAPRRDGDLIRSISYTMGGYTSDFAGEKGNRTYGGELSDPDLTVVVHAGNKQAFYARWIEFGISRSWVLGGRFAGSVHNGFGAQPFFYPAYRARKKNIKANMRAAAKRGVKKAVQ